MILKSKIISRGGVSYKSPKVRVIFLSISNRVCSSSVEDPDGLENDENDWGILGNF